jgi:alpha-glucosidase
MATRWKLSRQTAVLVAGFFLLTAFFAPVPLNLLAQTMAGRGASGSVLLASPNHRLQAHFATVRGAPAGGDGGALAYSVTYDGRPLVETSSLSLDLSGQPPLGTEVWIADATSGSGVDDYLLLGGKTSHVHDTYNSLKLQVVEPKEPRRTLIIEARAYDDGLAFRYDVPKQDAIQDGYQDLQDLEDLHLKQEHTEFRVSKDATAWALALPDFRSQYESEFLRLNLSALSGKSAMSRTVIGLPLLMHVPGVAWMAIAEADLEGNGAMYLMNPCGEWEKNCLQSKLAPLIDEPNLSATTNLPHHSAWRVLMIADDPGRLIESNLITDLNPPSEIKDTSWIRPGKVSWDWWGGDIGPDGKPAFTTKAMEYYVDFAAQSGFPYMLLDAGWSAAGDITKLRGNVNVPALVHYATSKRVKVWIWIPHKRVAAQMDTAFPLYEKWGVAGVKIDFVARDDQPGIQFYYTVAKKAAEHHLMLDFHGPTKPWGLSRTYPNVLGYEAVLGMERSKGTARDNPPHRAILPFTRMLVGPMDYTPGGFDNVTEDEFIPRMERPMVLGTRAQQLALYVVYLAPIQMVSDSPSAYAGQPEFQFIRDVPVVWDQTRVLNGFPGEFITMARRSGHDWFLGSITDWTARDLTVPLEFLGEGHYHAEIYEDAQDADRCPKHVFIRRQNVQKTDRLSLHLAPGGGCAIRFVYKPE